jgi:hypothetical protein
MRDSCMVQPHYLLHQAALHDNHYTRFGVNIKQPKLTNLVGYIDWRHLSLVRSDTVISLVEVRVRCLL